MPPSKSVIFLDLDGVVFHLVDHFGEFGVGARTENEVRLVEGLADVLDKLKAKGVTIVGVTNQPDIARKKITPEFLSGKHKSLQAKYPQITEIFACVHTETDLCSCRKPKPGMLLEASKKHDADFSKSWMIGDSRSDIEAGHAVRAKTILIQTKWNSESTTPVLGYVTAVAKDAKSALSLILALLEGTTNTQDT